MPAFDLRTSRASLNLTFPASTAAGGLKEVPNACNDVSMTECNVIND